ncbi:MAG: ubiE/COQ5 methyltransferase family protein [Bradyrhizobium sp.]|nr:ubiE/COQ5 methyltransferase family protein [Bradyrhizobium sp.]
MRLLETDLGQSEASAESNASYFLNHLSEYNNSVKNIDTYKTIHDFISAKVAGTNDLLDIGNGGVFAYDTSGVGSITAIDLFLGDLHPHVVSKHFPQNCHPVQGSALALPEPDGKFDMALMVMLLHHLTSTDWKSSWANAQIAIDEAWRVLKPGGRLLIVESCVPWWFFHIEKPALWALSRAIRSVFAHPVTLQFPIDLIADELGKKSDNVKVTVIPKGKFVLQFGFRVPSYLTPVIPFALETTKPVSLDWRYRP